MKHTQLQRSPWNRKPNKFGAKRTESLLIGRTFDSAAECRYAEYLFAREANGEIRDLQFQRIIPMVVNGVILGVRCRVDFVYFDHDKGGRLAECGGAMWVFDEFKGFPTPDYLTKKKLWIAGGGPCLYRVTRYVKGGVIHYVSDDHVPTGRKPMTNPDIPWQQQENE